jgi:hypothetical protein
MLNSGAIELKVPTCLVQLILHYSGAICFLAVYKIYKYLKVLILAEVTFLVLIIFKHGKFNAEFAVNLEIR